MKKILSAIAAAMCLATAAAQENNSNRNGNNVVTREVATDDFAALDLNGVMNVYLTKGDKAAVKVEADEKIQDKITVETVSGTLYVKTKKGRWSNVKKMNVYITYTSLEEIRNKMVGNLRSSGPIVQQKLRYRSSAVGNTELNFDLQELDADISAVGNTTFSGKAVNCVLVNTSVGNVRAGSLVVENMQLKTSAVGNLEYNAKNTTSLKSTGVGHVKNTANRTAGM